MSISEEKVYSYIVYNVTSFNNHRWLEKQNPFHESCLNINLSSNISKIYLLRTTHFPKIHESAIHKITKDLLYFWDAYDVNFWEKIR